MPVFINFSRAFILLLPTNKLRQIDTNPCFLAHFLLINYIMFNHFKRNLSILNKDAVETSWLKCLIDDVPKQKHLLVLK